MLRKINRRIYTLALAGLLPAGMVFAEVARQTQLDRESTELIGQVEDVARAISANAEELATLSGNMQISHRMHYDYLDRMKSQVNDKLQPALVRLEEMQPELPEWKQTAINRMLVSASGLAGQLNAAISLKVESGPMATPLNAEYRDLIERVVDHADMLAKTSDAAADYASAQFKAAGAGLEVPER